MVTFRTYAGESGTTLTCQFQRFLYQTLYVFSQMKDLRHIRLDFHSVTLVTPQGGTLGRLGCPGGQFVFQTVSCGISN